MNTEPWTTTTKIQRRAVFQLVRDDGAHLRLSVLMRWSSSDPLAVTFKFTDREWLLSRDLLAEGMDFPTGIGDVLLCPAESDSEHLRLYLSSPTGNAELLVPTYDLGMFLAETFTEMPSGLEVIPDYHFDQLLEDSIDEWGELS